MATKQELEQAVKDARANVESAEAALAAFEASPENNRFNDLDTALGTIEDALREEAYEDCQGAYNCGSDTYSREFYVGDTLYRGTADFEYNRHDKTYYYIEECNFTYEEVK